MLPTSYVMFFSLFAGFCGKFIDLFNNLGLKLEALVESTVFSSFAR